MTDKKNLLYGIYGFSLAACLSTAGVNIFLSVCFIALIIGWGKNKTYYTLLIRSPEKRILKTIEVFMFALLLSVVFSLEPVVSFKEFWSVYISRMLPFFFILAISNYVSKKEMGWIAVCINLSLTITSIYAIWQFWHGILRPNGFMANYMYLGSLYACLLPFGLISVIERTIILEKHLWNLNVLCYSINFAGMLANNTRGTWVAVALVSSLILICYTWTKRSVKYLTFLLVMILISGGIIGNNKMFMKRIESIPSTTVSSNHERLLLWQSSINMAKDYPLFGVGIGEFAKQYQTKYILPVAKEKDLEHAHNMFFHLLAEGGIIGMLGYLFLFGALIIGNFKSYIGNKNYTYLLACAVSTSVFIHGCTEFNVVVYKIFWLIIGWCIVQRIVNMEPKSLNGKHIINAT